MSVGGCYTDFHIDMGGTSVWYHILHGKKVGCVGCCSVCFQCVVEGRLYAVSTLNFLFDSTVWRINAKNILLKNWTIARKIDWIMFELQRVESEDLQRTGWKWGSLEINEWINMWLLWTYNIYTSRKSFQLFRISAVEPLPFILVANTVFMEEDSMLLALVEVASFVFLQILSNERGGLLHRFPHRHGRHVCMVSPPQRQKGW